MIRTEGKRKYVRVTPEQRIQLQELIAKNVLKIKEAAQMLDINYAAAKTILQQWRKKNMNKVNIYQSNYRCLTKKIEKQTNVTFKIISCVGGQLVNESVYPNHNKL